MVKKIAKIIFLYRLVFCFLLIHCAHAVFTPKQGSIIRDSEIETVLQDIVSPIFRVAGLNPKEAKIYIVVNSEMNAAATVDNTIFLNTGLLTKVSLTELIGIIAHETSHIALEHVSRFYGTTKNSSLISMASFALGVAIGAFGNADLGIGTIVLGNQIALRSLLHYSRGQEAAADQAAVRYLTKLQWPVYGLQNFLLRLSKREIFSSIIHNVYMITHPLSRTRVQLLDKYVQKYNDNNYKLPASLHMRYDRVIVKLNAFIQPPQHLLFTIDNQKISKKNILYAKAIAFYRTNQLSKSINVLRELCKLEPHNQYIEDLKGQIYYENGRIKQSIQSYKRALELAPNTPLIRLYYIQSLMQLNDYDKNYAIQELHKVLLYERKTPHIWHLLAVVYGKKGIMDRSSLCLAEKFLTLNKFDYAIKQATKADKITTDPVIKKKASDIINFANRKLALLAKHKLAN